MSPVAVAIVVGVGILSLGGLAVAAVTPSITSGGRARFLVDRGTFFRGLVMNRVVNGENHPHWGADIGADEGTPVHAAKSGVVIFSRPLRGYGNVVMLRHSSGGQSTLYAHMQRSSVQEGQAVAAGAIIGAVGSTRSGRNVQWNREAQRYDSVGEDSVGAVSAPISPHLHFEVHPTPIPQVGYRPRRLDPVAWLREEGIEMFGESSRGSESPRVA